MNSAPARAHRAELAQQCVKCGLCLPHCPTYNLAQTESESPRGRIALMAAMAEDPSLTGPFPHLDSCLGCRRCEAACPADVQYHSLLQLTRAAVAPALTLRDRLMLWLLAHKPVLNKGLRLYRSAYSLLPRGWRILPKPETAAANGGTERADVAIFSGCVADVYEAGLRQNLLQLLNACGIPACIPGQQVCCGQAAAHAGKTRQASHMAASNRTLFIGYRNVLVLASGCMQAMKESLGEAAQDAGEFLLSHGESLKFRSAGGLRVALHQPCTASPSAYLALLKRIPDLHIQLLPDRGCCGAAGLQQFSHADQAAKLRQPILDAVTNETTDVLLSQNIGCRWHLAAGSPVVVQHPLQFMAQFLHDT